MMLYDVMKVIDGILLVNDLFYIMSSPYIVKLLMRYNLSSTRFLMVGLMKKVRSMQRRKVSDGKRCSSFAIINTYTIRYKPRCKTDRALKNDAVNDVENVVEHDIESDVSETENYSIAVISIHGHYSCH